MGITYFKMLKNMEAELQGKIKSTVTISTEHKGYLQCMRVLGEVVNYAINMPKGKQTKRRLEVFWKTNLSYEDTCLECNTPYQYLRVFISHQSSLCYDKLGTDIFDYLKGCKPLDAMIEFFSRTGKISVANLIPAEFVTRIPQIKPSDSYKLEDCREELDFLKSLSIIGIQSRLDALDSDKLAYILWLLNSENSRYPEIRKKLWTYIYGKDEFKNVINDLKVKNYIT